MRFTNLLLVFLVSAAALCASDPFVGTWKMNPAKTKYKAGTAPKELTITVTEVGSDINVALAGTTADGSKIAYSYTAPSAGGDGKIESAFYDGVSAKRIGPNERETSYMKGGKPVYTAHSKLSADGDSLLVHSKGINSLGRPVEANTVYERQK